MEEKNEKNTGYTGEYGNPVEPAGTSDSQTDGAKKEDTTYSYSYQKGAASSTHFGDYYAADQAKYQSAGQTGTAQNNASGAGQNGFSGAGQDGAFGTGAPHQGQRFQSGPAPQPGQGAAGRPPKQKKPRKAKSGGSGSLAKKLLICAACAAVFGVVAGVCFQGVRYVSDRFMPTQSSQTQLKTTTENSSDTDKTASSDSSSTTTATGVATTDVSSITEQTMPAIVAITSTTQGANYYDLFGQEYQGQESTSAGSGFIVAQNDNELLIATNNHVIEDAKTISVQFIDDEIYEATVKGTDSSNDLAVIAVPVKNIKDSTMKKIAIADLGSSDDLKVGEMVIAIGNALGYGQSVTVGYVSAKDREISASDDSNSYGSSSSSNTIKAIQTDAAINPGNSGGALINMRGEVIGINSAKIADSTVEGIGYAIPISVATPIIEDLMNKESLSDDEKGYLGISGQTVTDAATAFNIPNGVQVVEVAKDGAADKAGVQVGDIITAINNMEVRSIESLQEKANSYKKGTEVEITLQRSDNGTYKEKTLKVKLQGSSSLDSLSDSSKSSSGSSGSSDDGSYGNGSSDNGNSGNGSSGNGNSNGNGNSGNGNSGSDGSGSDNSFGNLFNFFN